MRRIAGVADAATVVNKFNPGKQSVQVIDAGERIFIELSSSYPAGLSPKQARYLAECLIDSAMRAEVIIREREDRDEAERLAALAELDEQEADAK